MHRYPMVAPLHFVLLIHKVLHGNHPHNIVE
jgi:hypothetical protein